MELCDACKTLANALSGVIHNGHDHPLSQTSIRHGLDFNALNASRTKCRLCQLLHTHNPLAHAREQSDGRPAPFDVSVGGYAIEISPKWDVHDRLDYAGAQNQSGWSSKVLKWLHVNVTQTTAQGERTETDEKRCWPTVLQMYGIRDALPITASLCRRYRFQSSGSNDAFSLYRQWLSNCLSYHDVCRHDDLANHSKRREQFSLPTRVIDVGSKSSPREPRLLITKGKLGSWVALSHCWGKPTVKPPTTTKANLQERLKQIRLDELPKTFRDAVIITRELNIKYLWIDSLCIVQDDVEDWRRECETMGLLYQNSLVTLSAADAMDSNEGFFSNTTTLSYSQLRNARASSQSRTYRHSNQQEQVTEQWNGPIGEGVPAVIEGVKLPYHVIGNEGTFYISPKDDFEVQPMESPLFNRGWVTQEWVLSRRTLLFLKDAVVWTCGEVSEDERGNTIKLNKPTILNWQSLMETYTKNQLTYESDRLAAIRGLANSLQNVRPDTYFAGLWTGDLPQALLWMKPEHCLLSNTFSHLPSWTWARTNGPVSFQLRIPPYNSNNTTTDAELEQIYTSIDLNPSGVLQITGPLKQVDNSVAFVHKQDINKLTDQQYKTLQLDNCFIKRCFNGQSNCRESTFGSLYRKGLSIVLKKDGSRLGWAAWDADCALDVRSECIYCLGLVLERSCMQAVPAIPESVTDAYHVLFLREEKRISHAKMKVLATMKMRYVRVGMGVVLKDEWFESAPLRTVFLV